MLSSSSQYVKYSFLLFVLKNKCKWWANDYYACVCFLDRVKKKNAHAKKKKTLLCEICASLFSNFFTVSCFFFCFFLVNSDESVNLGIPHSTSMDVLNLSEGLRDTMLKYLTPEEYETVLRLPASRNIEDLKLFAR